MPAIAVVTLGCGRNEVDSEQVMGSLSAAGYRLVDDPGDADCVLVNTCTFIEPARAESIDTVLAATELGDGTMPVLVIGCMAERYGAELAEALPEVAGVLGFADYPHLPQRIAEALGSAGTARRGLGVDGWNGNGFVSRPANRMLPLIGGVAAPAPSAPPTAGFPVRTVPRNVWAYLKIAGGCDRSCTFCTIPSYRGTFRSRPLAELVAEARWLVEQGVAEIVCVSENTTSWGKDLPEGRDRQSALVAALGAVEGLERFRLLYLQPDELTEELIAAIASTATAASYYDLSLQHASPRIVRAMARGGGAEDFLALISHIRGQDPGAVLRSSFIVGFPGETEADVETLDAFLTEAGLDWVGFFVYSPEEGTRSAALPNQVDEGEARRRRDHLLATAEAVAEERADSFIGRALTVLVEDQDGPDTIGRSYREAPETDGEVRLIDCEAPPGRMLEVEVTATDGVDLVASPVRAAGDRSRIGG